ncbi:MAG: GNAT family N-acetyltransferase [Thermoguttaceae bacterium]
MSGQRIIHLTGIDELRSAASQWDDLWWRSEVSLPTVRAELLAQWLEQFGRGVEFHAIGVETDGRWVAALPLVSRKLAGIMPAALMPCNPWSSSGDLLLDEESDVAESLCALLEAIGNLSWPWLWLNETVIHSRRWQAFIQACNRAQMPSAAHERYNVARIEISSNWETFLKSLSRSHRQATSKAVRRMEELGDVRFEMQSCLELRDVRSSLEKVFEVEDLSWKGEGGSSVFSTCGMFEFFQRQAEQLSEWGQLEIATLELEGRPIASLFGFSAKGVYHAHKIGYDPQFSHFSPGQVLFWHLLERLHADGQWQAIDCLGPLSEAASRWRPATYTIGRVVVAPGRLLGRTAMQVYKNWWPALRRMREKLRKEASSAHPADSLVKEPLGVPGG